MRHRKVLGRLPFLTGAADPNLVARETRSRSGWLVRRLAAGLIVLGLTAAIAAAFWYQDWRYSLPTPQPPAWHSVAVGTHIDLPQSFVLNRLSPRQCILLHFFNSSCPCSRFNLDEVRALIRDYGQSVRFIAVLQGNDARVAQEKFAALDLGIVGIADVNGRIAAACGVYSTPQAVILNADQRLVYRGNYNLSRFCTSPHSAFARRALEATLAGQPLPDFPSTAVTPYGCGLPAWNSEPRAKKGT